MQIVHRPVGGETIQRCKRTLLVLAVIEMLLSVMVLLCCIIEPQVVKNAIAEKGRDVPVFIAYYHYSGYACGVFGIIASGLGIGAVFHPQPGLTIAHMVLCILTAIASCVTFIIAVSWAALIKMWTGWHPAAWEYVQHYYTGPTVIWIASLVLMILTIVSSSILCSKCGRQSEVDVVHVQAGPPPIVVTQGMPAQHLVVQQGQPMAHVEMVQQPVAVEAAPSSSGRRHVKTDVCRGDVTTDGN